MECRKNFFYGFGAALVGIALAWLLGIVAKEDQAQLDALTALHAKELSTCWAEVGVGETCKIEYIRDRTDTVIGAKVIKESK